MSSSPPARSRARGCCSRAASGTAHDQVGRYLQGHVYAGAVGMFDEPVQDSAGPGPSISTTDFRHHNDGVLGGGILVNEFVPTPIEAYAKLSALGVVPAWGEAGVEGMRDAYSRTAFVVGPLQEVPSASARVTIEPRVSDRHGVPAVRLLADRPRPRTTARRAFLQERAAEWLRASGARDDRGDPLVAARGPSASQHQAGTCRMGTDPRTSVTDRVGARVGPRRRDGRRRLAARHQRRRQPGAHHPRARVAGERAARRRARLGQLSVSARRRRAGRLAPSRRRAARAQRGTATR